MKKAAICTQDCYAILGSFRLDYEYEIEYKHDFSILVFRFHIITTHQFHPMSYSLST